MALHHIICLHGHPLVPPLRKVLIIGLIGNNHSVVTVKEILSVGRLKKDIEGIPNNADHLLSFKSIRVPPHRVVRLCKPDSSRIARVRLSKVTLSNR